MYTSRITCLSCWLSNLQSTKLELNLDYKRCPFYLGVRISSWTIEYCLAHPSVIVYGHWERIVIHLQNQLMGLDSLITEMIKENVAVFSARSDDLDPVCNRTSTQEQINCVCVLCATFSPDLGLEELFMRRSKLWWLVARKAEHPFGLVLMF